MVLVDSNVIFDWLNRDPVWFDWSSAALEEAIDGDGAAINALIFAEVAAGLEERHRIWHLLSPLRMTYLNLPYEAAFAAGAAFTEYRRRGGEKRSPMPDFYIGAHADLLEMPLLTRDVRRFRTYFPGLRLITPPGL